MNMDPKVRPALFNVLCQLNKQSTPMTLDMRTALNELNIAALNAGKKMFGLNSLEDAEHFLNIVAAAGNAWCQFAMATCGAYRDGIGHRESGGIISHASEETKKWLNLAAAQDYIPALIQLGDTQSQEKAKALITNLPPEETPQGMYYMYLITNDANWLEKSADAGWNQARYKLASLYRREPQRIANEALRLARIEELNQQSADSGLPLAVYARVFSDKSTASIAEKQTRLVQLARMGHVEGMLEYGYALANLPRDLYRATTPYGHELPAPRTYGLPKDLGLAYAQLKYIQKQAAGAVKAPTLAEDLHTIEMGMSPTDAEKANTTLRELAQKNIEPFYRVEELIIPGTAK